MPEGHRRDERAEAQLPRDGGERGEGCPAVERAVRVGRVEAEVVVGAEERPAAVPLARPREGDPLIPGPALLAFDHQRETHERERLIEPLRALEAAVLLNGAVDALDDAR